jgi:hypothetical protein
MNKWLRAALAGILANEAEYFLIFDSLDLDFDPVRQDLQDSLIGLLLASQEFTAWNASVDRKAAVVVLIREDIFDTLHFQEKNKLFNQLVERIHWREDGNGPNSLKTVVDTRIRVLLGDLQSDNPWNLVFSPQRSYHHLVARTYLRPRDIIQFANICLATARDRVRGRETDIDRVSHADIAAARASYSEYLRRELDDEIHAHHPNWEKWLELLRRVEVTNFTQEAFADVCLKAPELACGMSAAAILEMLYQFGLIGFAGRLGALGHSEYWKYRNPEVAFDHTAQYRVHPGLRETLYPAGPRDFAKHEEQVDSDSVS